MLNVNIFFKLSIHPSILRIRKGRLQTDGVRDTLVVFAHDDKQKEQEERCKAPGALGTLHDGS